MQSDCFKQLVGRVEWIGVSRHRRAEIVTADRVRLIDDEGIHGDHHGKRQVTLLQSEHLPVIAALLGRTSVAPSLLRRNLVVSEINLMALLDRKFEIGGAILEGITACRPCQRMEENLGAGGYHAMCGHGGLVARVVQGGWVRIGDRVQILEDSQQEQNPPPATTRSGSS